MPRMYKIGFKYNNSKPFNAEKLDFKSCFEGVFQPGWLFSTRWHFPLGIIFLLSFDAHSPPIGL